MKTYDTQEEIRGRFRVMIHVRLHADDLDALAAQYDGDDPRRPCSDGIERFRRMLPDGIDCEWTPTHGLLAVVLFGADYRWAADRGLVPDLALDRAYLAGANLAGASLARANLDCANLARANLARANLAGANLAGAYLDCANLDGALWPSGHEPPQGWRLNEHGRCRRVPS